jgi:hypothetical protein
MSNLGIISYESFFSFIDKDDVGRSSRELTVKYNNGYAQVFQAKSDTIENIFFMADVTVSTDGGTANADELSIDIVQLTQSGTSFTVGGAICPTVTAEDCVRLGRSSLESTGDAYWYTYNCSVSVTSGQYYAILFTSSNANGTAKIYFTEDYRSDVFPLIMTSSSGASPNWSNALFTSGREAFGGTRIGSLCCGFLGNTIEEGGDSFDSGDVNIGGSDSHRGYQVYLYVVKTDSDVSVRFTQRNPDTGMPEEGNRSAMSWYWYEEGTLPISNNTSLLNDTTISARLEGVDSFALFVQPDKFAPYPKLYFPETALTLKNEKIDINDLEDLVGKKWFIRTVTYHTVGKVTKIVGNFLVMEQATWVADSGRFMGAIKEGTLNETEPVGECMINISSIVDMFPWKHSLKINQK